MFLPLSVETFREEVVTIEHLTRIKRFTLDIDRMIREKLISETLNSIIFHHRNPLLRKKFQWICLSYVERLFSELSKLLKSSGFRPVLYNITMIAELVCSHKDSIPALMEKNGVYCLLCSNYLAV